MYAKKKKQIYMHTAIRTHWQRDQCKISRTEIEEQIQTANSENVIHKQTHAQFGITQSKCGALDWYLASLHAHTHIRSTKNVRKYRQNLCRSRIVLISIYSRKTLL